MNFISYFINCCVSTSLHESIYYMVLYLGDKQNPIKLSVTVTVTVRWPKSKPTMPFSGIQSQQTREK